MARCRCSATHLSLSVLICLLPLLPGYSSSVIQTPALADDGHIDGGSRDGEKTTKVEGLYFSLKHRDSPKSPFLQRYKSRQAFLQTVLQRDEVRAKSFVDHIVNRRPRKVTGMVAEKEFMADLDSSPPDPTLHDAPDPGTLIPPAGAGEYYTELYVGTPRQLLVAMVDFGSDVVWMGEPSSRLQRRRSTEPVNSYFYPSSSSSFTPIPSSSSSCLRVEGIPVCGNRNACRMMVGTEEQYVGALEFAHEVIRWNETAQYHASVMNELLFCVSKVLVPTGGVFGLGRGMSSFATQIGKRHLNRFAYCLADTDEPSGSSLVFDSRERDSNLQFTPLVEHPYVETFYFVNLVAVAVNGVKLPIPSRWLKMSSEGKGGTIIDISTRFSRLPKRAFDQLVKAVKALITLPATVVPGFQLCYNIANLGMPSIPALTLVFESGARMNLPLENLFVSASEHGNILCLAMVPGSPGSPTVIGSTQQQNFLMVIDREKSRLGFAPRQCASLPNM